MKKVSRNSLQYDISENLKNIILHSKMRRISSEQSKESLTSYGNTFHSGSKCLMVFYPMLKELDIMSQSCDNY